MDKSELSFKFSIPITLDDVNGYKQAMCSYMSLLHTYEIAIKKREQDFNNQLKASIEKNIFIRAEQDIAVQTEQEPIQADKVSNDTSGIEKVKKIRKPRIVNSRAGQAQPVGNENIL
jgi:hypothetical protein